jgi:hypothetical protein
MVIEQRSGRVSDRERSDQQLAARPVTYFRHFLAE